MPFVIGRPSSTRALEHALLKDKRRSVTAHYITDEQGVVWPADFHTWNLVTTYYNFERAWDYFSKTVDVKQVDLPQTTAYYFPDFVLADASDKPQRDNAIFFAPAKAFLVLPFEKIEKAPLAINASILTHEYAHLVFNRRAYGGLAIPEPIAAWSETMGTPTPGLNVLKSLDEGLADFHAYGASCQSTFGCSTRVLETSFEGTTGDDRDLSKNWCMSKDLRDQLLYSNFATFSGREYQVGTILASALYKSAKSASDRQVLLRAVAAAYSDMDLAKPGFAQLARKYLGEQPKFTLARAVRAIVQHIPASPPELKTAVCTNLATHLQIPAEELSGALDESSTPADCPISTPVTSSCVSINP